MTDNEIDRLIEIYENQLKKPISDIDREFIKKYLV